MLDIKEVLKRNVVCELSTANQEVVDMIIDKIIESKVLVEKGNKIVIEPMSFKGNYYGSSISIDGLFDEESPYHDVVIELCEDCLVIFYCEKGEKHYKSIHNENGDNMLDKKFAKKLYDYIERNELSPIKLF